mmetsp:Transcript_10824/g.11934  ORF Transcript_10824/g.11934 Transcript_10824/m.11934 type:complete len:406 (+) Transcript_10824:33-1250(+)
MSGSTNQVLVPFHQNDAHDHRENPLLKQINQSLKIEKADGNTSGSSLQSATRAQTWQVIVYMLTFFFMMIGHEVALEAASTNFSHLNSLASAVTLFQFGFCFFLPFISSKGEVCKTFPKTWRQTLPYIKLSILVFGATGLATESLKYVAYPTKVVFKSAKLIPTMIVSTIMNRSNKNYKSKYGFFDYFAALLLCIGAAGYSVNSNNDSTLDGGKEENQASEEEFKSASIYGISLLIISICCDAVVPNIQQKLMAAPTQYNGHYQLLPTSKTHDTDEETYKKEACGLSAQAVMVNTNAIGFAFILFCMILSGHFRDTISIAMVDPRLFLYLTCVGLGLSTAVLAYTKLINASGSVVAVAVSTLRKVATVLLSYALFPKPLLQIHLYSGFLVLIGVLIGTFCRKKNK